MGNMTEQNVKFGVEAEMKIGEIDRAAEIRKDAILRSKTKVNAHVR